MAMDAQNEDFDEQDDARFEELREEERQRRAYAAFQKRLLAEKLTESGQTAENMPILGSQKTPDLIQALKDYEREHPEPDDLRRREATAAALDEWRRHHENEATNEDDTYRRFEQHYDEMTTDAEDAALEHMELAEQRNRKEKRRNRKKQDDEDWYWYYYFQ